MSALIPGGAAADEVLNGFRFSGQFIMLSGEGI
jgi:hypothetical protein